MTLLLSAVLLSLAAQPALAQRRANKPFNTVNGRTTTQPLPSRARTITTPGGGAAANAPATVAATSRGGRTFYGGGHQAASRSSSGRAVRRSGNTFWGGGGRKLGGGETTSTEEAPPNYSKPGALIRTTGQQPKYEKAEAARIHRVDAGEIVLNTRKARDSGRAPSLQHGPKDTLPPPNPGTGGSNYTSGASANSPSSSNGKDNNGSGNNDKNKPGDSYDPPGGDKGMAESFYDAY